MGELRTAVQVLGAVALGYLLIGEQLVEELYFWFGWRVTGPLTWLHQVIGSNF